jgi:AraC-like DNA-binding protein
MQDLDGLSELLAGVRLERAQLARIALGAGRGLRQGEDMGSADVACYHVLAGACVLEVAGRPAQALARGGLLLLTRGAAHRLRASEAAGCTLLQGMLAFDAVARRQLFDRLPPVLAVQAAGPLEALQSATCAALEQADAGDPGQQAVLQRLAETLVLQAVASLLAREPALRLQLLPAGDGVVHRCLALMHQRPDAPWTLPLLAREVHASRSVLAERFASVVGEPPMGYLTRWRLAEAARLLRGSSWSLGRVAEAVGYQSEPAFCRAFRRQYGAPPASWRRQQARMGPAPAAAPQSLAA